MSTKPLTPQSSGDGESVTAIQAREIERLSKELGIIKAQVARMIYAFSNATAPLQPLKPTPTNRPARKRKDKWTK